ncbi:UbiD family decarboxylase domain-containing protein [Paenibacillus sp. 32352]|uniref:UbiD family decarboxylase domain-containing protein n=1 Tax=Paenibacillus sp. 32352 TaxID=1969111 RepID=UPI0021198614|nr:UbiD family decarboxylase domain-containing protein [Paenibacillus sp. 32352]
MIWSTGFGLGILLFLISNPWIDVGSYIPKVIVVNDDIDPSNINQVVWALATRHHPDKTIVMAKQQVLPLVAYLDQAEKKEALTAKAIYNCLPSDEWPKDYAPLEASFASYPEELRNRILTNWESYGF